MKRGATGRYDVSSTSGETVRAFIPGHLPPKPPLDLTGSCQRLLEKALLACGRLDGVAERLPDPNLFLYAYLRREAVLSSQIEGTQSSLSELLLFELDEAPGVPFDDVVEVSNYVSALEHGLARLRDNFPLSGRLVREIHEKLMIRGRGADKQPGAYRTSQNWIGGTRPGNAHFVPPPPMQVAECMAELERFIHGREDGLPDLVRVALAHVQFETIHPFLDGNGRTGRLLIALMLSDSKVLAQPLLYLSLYFKRHRVEYYRLLDVVRIEGDWEEWLGFFLEGVASTAQSAVDTAHRLLKLFDEDAARVRCIGRAASTTLRVLEALRARPVMNIKALVIRIGASYPPVSRAIELLERLGIAREITGRKRNRVFVYTKYLEIINEGAEPL